MHRVRAYILTIFFSFVYVFYYTTWNKLLAYYSGSFRLGPGGHRPPNLAQSPTPKKFNWFYGNFDQLYAANKPCDIRTLSWIGHSRSFQVILVGAGRNPERCVVVMCMPTLFLKRTQMWQRENCKFVDFSDHTQVWRRLSKKRLRISTHDLYCQKLEPLSYIFATDSIGLYYFSRNYL